MILGIDIGGTNIKFGVVDQDYNIVEKYSIPTEAHKGDVHIVSNIIRKSKAIFQEYPIEKVGIGTPGRVDSVDGICISAVNIPYCNTPIVAMLEKELGVKVSLQNDAVCAIWGELRAGVGRHFKNFIMITLGTGVGGGICIDGKPYLGKTGTAGEFGHMTINYDGILCRCGQRGCYEQYASVTALIQQTKEAAANHPHSLLAQMGQKGFSGRSAFNAKSEGCSVAAEVVELYAEYVAVGIKNLKRIFAPEAVVIGGAISNQEDNLLNPLRNKVGASVNLCVSHLKNDAGIIGAAVIAE